MSASKVFCSKLKEELPSLSNPPFSGELGQRILANVSERAWTMWSDDMMIKVINEYRLNLAEAEDYNTLLEQMKHFLGLSESADSAQLDVAPLEVGNPERGK